MLSRTSRSLLAVAQPLARRQIHATPTAFKLHDSILDTIGDTPIVRLNRLPKRKDVDIYVKCEFFNPLSSVKDRMAYSIIEDAEKSGALKPGQTVVEGTSGNTGVALAMVCAAKGYPLVVTMAESFSVERRKTMRALGAKVILTPAAQRGTGMVAKAKELAEAHGWFQPLQFENPANPRFHAATTGSEILQDFAGKRLDYWVTGYGTGGTFTGAGKVLKAARPDLKIVVTEPELAPLLQSGTPQPKGESHPAWTPHAIQGWTPDFIAGIIQQSREENPDLVDELMTVSNDDSIATSLALASQEGIFAGISAGGTVATALELSEKVPSGSVILAMVPDTAERYMSTPLFATVDADMNADEIEVSQSTPNFQLPEEN